MLSPRVVAAVEMVGPGPMVAAQGMARQGGRETIGALGSAAEAEMVAVEAPLAVVAAAVVGMFMGSTFMEPRLVARIT